MILIIDNRDSFVFNIARYFEELGATVEVYPADALTLEAIAARRPAGLVISPGPQTPAEAELSCEAVRRFSGALPVLGVCLGHQCLGAAFGGEIARAVQPAYGQAAAIAHDGAGLFEGAPQPLTVGLYHSLIVRETPMLLSECVVSARSPAGEVMALRHRRHPTFGVQFHPESILSEAGHALLANFLKRTREAAAA